MLEKKTHEAFQALWIEISFSKQENVICGILYRRHNSPECFIEYFSNTIAKLASTGKTIHIMADFNLCLLKTEKSQYSQDFLLALQSSYLFPTIDKPTRVHRVSASFIDNIFVSGNIVTDVSDHFSQFAFWLQEERKLLTKQQQRNATSQTSPLCGLIMICQ